MSTPAFLIRDLSWLMLAVSAAIFAVVAYLLVHALVRFRARRGEDDREPPQVYGSNSIEIAWIVVPLLIVVVLFLATARTIFDIERAAAAGAPFGSRWSDTSGGGSFATLTWASSPPTSCTFP